MRKLKDLVVRLSAMILAFSLLAAGDPSPTSGQTATPSSSPGYPGSISGRVYVDVNANGTFDRPDAPLTFALVLFLLDVSGPPFASLDSSSDGTYRFDNLPAGNYELFINLPASASCAVPIAPFSWVGDTFAGIFCEPYRLTTRSHTFPLAIGEDAIGVDFPEVPSSYDVRGRIWLNGRPLSTGNQVAIAAGGRECWSAQVNTQDTAAGVLVTSYSASLVPSEEPSCQSGDLNITIDGRSVGAETEWNAFWRDSLSSGAKPLNRSSDVPPFLSSTDLAVPPFLEITGQVVESGTVTPDTVTDHDGVLMSDGSVVRALVGKTVCGASKTKTLTTEAGRFGGNLFGLSVPSTEVEPGCGTPGAPMTFCIGDFTARQPAAGPFSSFASPEAVPVFWAAPALVDLTLEPTNEECPVTLSPAALPETGGRPSPK